MSTCKMVLAIAGVCAALATTPALAQMQAPPVRRAAPAAATGTMSASALGMTASALSVYTPPACVPGVPFADITCSTGFDPWIEQFGLDGISAGCGGGNYCPASPVTRNEMAVFIEKAMHGTANWPPHTVLVYHHPMAESSSNLNSGTELMNLVAAIPSTGPEAPASGNPWVIKLGPGTWDLGSSTLYVPGWVSFEGSGEEETVITSATTGVSVTMNVSSGVTTLTRLTVQNFSGSGSGAYAVQINSGRLVLDRAFAYALGSASYQVGIYASDSAVEVYNEAGVFASGGTSFGIYNAGSQYHLVTVHHALVEGLTNAIYNAAGYEVDMAYSGVYDAPLANFGAGVYKCIGNYDRNEAAVTCP